MRAAALIAALASRPWVRTRHREGALEDLGEELEATVPHRFGGDGRAGPPGVDVHLRGVMHGARRAGRRAPGVELELEVVDGAERAGRHLSSISKSPPRRGPRSRQPPLTRRSSLAPVASVTALWAPGRCRGIVATGTPKESWRSSTAG